MIRKNTVTWSEIFILACAGNLHFLERRPKNILLKNQNSKWNNFCHVAHNVLFSSASWWSDDESASQIRLFPMNWFAVRVNRCRVRKHAGDERHKEQVGSPRDQEPAQYNQYKGSPDNLHYAPLGTEATFFIINVYLHLGKESDRCLMYVCVSSWWIHSGPTFG